MSQPKYRIYPSLLDKFEDYLRADEEAESFFNVDRDTGEYKRSPDEIEAELKRSLIDAINRVPFSSEAADKGTAFNALIDSMIHLSTCPMIQLSICSMTHSMIHSLNCLFVSLFL